jgi:hypothetical protein
VQATLPPIPDIEPIRQYDVLLAPWSIYPSRMYPLGNWRLIQEQLEREGWSVGVLAGRLNDNQRDEMRYFRNVEFDLPPRQVCGLMLGSQWILGIDSGCTHVAGMLRRPTVALCAQIRGEKLFGIYPSVRVVNTPESCGGCHWQGSQYRDRCNRTCAALDAIKPETVLNIVGSKTLLAPDRQEALQRLVRETEAVVGDMAEVGVYKGGSARLMASVSKKRLHLFGIRPVNRVVAGAQGNHGWGRPPQ